MQKDVLKNLDLKLVAIVGDLYTSRSVSTTATNLAVQRMQAWGFSGFGKWASDAGGLPILPVLEGYNVPLVARHADIFDPNVQALFRASLHQQMQARICRSLRASRGAQNG